MTRKGLRQFPAFVNAMVGTATKVLEEQAKLSPKAAQAAALTIASAVCDQFARTKIYIPLFDEARLAERDESILVAYEKPGPDEVRPFTPERVRQLAAQFALTETQVYCIIKRARLQDAAQRRDAAAESAG